MSGIRRVFVTGGTGFVGRVLIQALRSEGCVVRCLVRRGSERDLHGLEAIERVEGDVLAPRSLEDAMAGCEAAVHLVGIIREYPGRGVTFERLHTEATANVVSAATTTGVRRLVHMSALGTRPGAASRYHRTKWTAEEAVRSSPLSWTIFRPSVIYGRGDHLVSALAPAIRWLPVVPVLGDGRQRLQPVAVEHVAEGFARSLALSETVKQTYEVGGPEAITMSELLDRIGEVVGRRPVRKVRVPLAPVRQSARLLHRVRGFPITPDQLLMLAEDNTCDPSQFYSTFGIKPLPLRHGLARMLG